MDAQELLEELELRFPEKLAEIEMRHQDALEALDYGEGDTEIIEELEDDLREMLRI